VNNAGHVNPGELFASANTPKASVRMLDDADLRWLPSSQPVRRDRCGRPSVALGAVDGHTALQLEGHIFVSEKGDDCALTDGLPQSAR
jgi:hypothetical protein